MARMAPLAGGKGSLLEIDFRIRAQASAGSTAVDLQFASLNDTRLTLNPAPMPGKDPTDGVVTIVKPEPAVSAAANRVNWAAQFAGLQGDSGSKRSQGEKDDDWMKSSWARDLTDRLAPSGSGTAGGDAPRSRTALPGRELLRSISRVFRR
jgi:hypothetical protein